MEKKESELSLTPKEKKVIEFIRETQYGEVKIIIKNYQPVGIEEITKSITL